MQNSVELGEIFWNEKYVVIGMSYFQLRDRGMGLVGHLLAHPRPSEP